MSIALRVVPRAEGARQPATVLYNDAPEIAARILGDDYLLWSLRECISLWCDWRGLKFDPQTPILQIGRSYTTSDFWESAKTTLLETNETVSDEVDHLAALMDEGLLPPDEVFERIDTLTEALLPTVLEDEMAWLPRHSCYTSVLFQHELASIIHPDKTWKICLSHQDAHAFAYCEESNEIFDMLIPEYTPTHHSTERIFDTPEEYLKAIETMDC